MDIIARVAAILMTTILMCAMGFSTPIFFGLHPLVGIAIGFAPVFIYAAASDAAAKKNKKS
jgi:hypothetical protein